MTIYFVTENNLKSIAGISKNLDIELVLPWVKTEAEIRVEPILGSAYFNYLLERFNNMVQGNTPVLSNDEVALVRKMVPCIAWRAAAETVGAASRPLKNIGIQKMDSEHSSSVDLAEVTFWMEHYNQKAANYQGRLIDYLMDNRDLYPLIMASNNRDSLIQKRCRDADASIDDDGFFTMDVY